MDEAFALFSGEGGRPAGSRGLCQVRFDAPSPRFFLKITYW
jgi:hypothetical protein